MNKLLAQITSMQMDNDNLQAPKAEGQIQSNIFIKDYLLDMSLGVYPEEHTKKQRVKLNIEVDFEFPKNWQTDSIRNTIAYDDIILAIEKMVEGRHFNLVETFAAYIADFCLNDDRARAVRIRVEKLDVYGEKGSVGVDYAFTR